MALPPRPPPTSDDDVKGRIRQVITQTDVPSWFQKPPARFGEKGVGAIKSSEWRNLYTLHIPFALISLWSKDANPALKMTYLKQHPESQDGYTDILVATMHLVSALFLMNKRVQSERTADAYRKHLADWYQAIQRIWTGVKAKQNCHAAFHVWDFLQLFGPAAFWWCYSFERLIGHLERLPHNHTKRELKIMLLIVI